MTSSSSLSSGWLWTWDEPLGVPSQPHFYFEFFSKAEMGVFISNAAALWHGTHMSSARSLPDLTVDSRVPRREGVVCCARDLKGAFRCPMRLTFCFLRKLMWKVSEQHPYPSCSLPLCVECSNPAAVILFRGQTHFQDSESWKPI